MDNNILTILTAKQINQILTDNGYCHTNFTYARFTHRSESNRGQYIYHVEGWDDVNEEDVKCPVYVWVENDTIRADF